MFGRSAGLNKMKKVKIGGVTYESMSMASLKLGKQRSYINNRVKKFDSKMPCGMAIEVIKNAKKYPTRA